MNHISGLRKENGKLERKTVSEIMLLLLVISTLTFTFNTQLVKAESGTTYIRADGSIDPPTAPISTIDNVTYTLTDNIISDGDGIVVERDNIVADGVGYTLQGTGSGTGIDLSYRSNVTIKNMKIKSFRIGVDLFSFSSNYNSIVGNSITNTNYGIWLTESSNYNSIIGNNIKANNRNGIGLRWSSNNSIYHNNFIDNTLHAYIESTGYPNVWDDGYPSGGSYWSDYAGVDSDDDGIGDTPYIIDENNQDKYPLMKQWGVEEIPEEDVSSPIWTQWWFWAIIALVIPVVAGTVYFLKKK